MKTSPCLYWVAACLIIASPLPAQKAGKAEAKANPAPEEGLAKSFGWKTNLERGGEILKVLTALSAGEAKRLNIAAYGDERVAFSGGTAPPGGTNDLVTEKGYYLRVVNPAGKDLRPHAVWWPVIVCGKIQRVLLQNKIIVIEVDEKDWKVIETG